MFSADTPTTSFFVGRQQEITDIGARLLQPTCRLLSLIGIGGAGKTTLAQTIANSLQSAFPDGVYFVALQSLDNAENIIPTLADALNFRFFGSETPRQQLLGFLQHKTLLLLMDNFEHVLAGVELVSAILQVAPHVKILVTSRERLNLQQEWVYEVRGLTFPNPNEQLDLTTYSSMTLFIHHACRIKANFVPEKDLTTIAQICALLEGMPLAIELVANRIRVLSCAEILDEIQQGLDIFETTAPDVPIRHRNMRAVLAQSWNLLPPNEQHIFMILSVFRGGFAREAAQAIGASLDKLTTLIDKSWLHYDPSSKRYTVHELLRKYGEEQLALAGKTEAALRLHSVYYANFMQERLIQVKGQRQRPALQEIEHDFENVRAALYWLAQQHEVDGIDKMLETLFLFCDFRGRFIECRRMLEDILAYFAARATPDQEMLWAVLNIYRIATFAYTYEYSERELQSLQEYIAMVHRYQRWRDFAWGNNIMARIYITQKDTFAKSILLIERSFMIVSELDDAYYTCDILVLMALWQPHKQFTICFLEYAAEMQRKLGNRHGLAWTLSHLATGAFEQEKTLTLANVYAAEAMAIQHENQDNYGLCYSLYRSNQRNFAIGNFRQARLEIEEMVRIARYIHNAYNLIHSLATLAFNVLVMDEDYEQVNHLCEEAMNYYVPYSLDAQVIVTFCLAITAYVQQNTAEANKQYQHLLSLISSGLFRFHGLLVISPLAIFMLASVGNSVGATQLMARLFTPIPNAQLVFVKWVQKWGLMLRLMQTLETELGAEQFAAAWAQGQTLDLERDIAPFVMDIQRVMSADSLIVSARTPQHPNLTERETEILRCVAAGMTNQEIADQLVLAFSTVKWYISQIYSKLGVRNRTQALAAIREMGYEF